MISRGTYFESPAALIVVVCLALVGCGEATADLGAVSAAEVVAPSVNDLPTVDVRLSVAEAYQAIPHRQTTFRFDQTSIPEVEARYLAAMFHLIDQATRVRVAAYGDLYHRGSTETRPSDQFQLVIDSIEELQPPAGLEPYQRAIVDALETQQDVLEEWVAAGSGFGQRDHIGRHGAVRRASKSLQQAYAMLMARYGADESSANREAMFDYHCALDFI